MRRKRTCPALITGAALTLLACAGPSDERAPRALPASAVPEAGEQVLPQTPPAPANDALPQEARPPDPDLPDAPPPPGPEALPQQPIPPPDDLPKTPPPPGSSALPGEPIPSDDALPATPARSIERTPVPTIKTRRKLVPPEVHDDEPDDAPAPLPRNPSDNPEESATWFV